MKCEGRNRAGEPCGRFAVKGRRHCQMHGGHTLRGLGHPNFKDGRFSKSLPARLVGRYQEAAQDPELISVRHEIALAHARVCDLLSRVDSGESGELWQTLHLERNRLLECRRRGDNAGISACLNQLLETIRVGHQDFTIWSEISKLVELQRRLAETEQRRMVAMHQYMTVEEAMSLATGIMSAMKRHITDKALLGAIAHDLELLMDRQK